MEDTMLKRPRFNNVKKNKKENSVKIQLMTLSTAQIKSNTDYQRDIDTKKVAKIVSNFDEHKLGVIKVSYRDGRYYVFDGQHRLAAVKLLNAGKDTMIKCEVHYGLTYADEARLFAEQYDGATKVDVLCRYKALYESGDSKVIKLKQIVEDCGFKLDFKKMKGDNRFVCVAALNTMYNKIGEEKMRKCLDLIKKTWNGESTSLDKEIIAGMTILYSLYGDDIQEKVFIRKLKGVEPIVLKRKGKSDLLTKGDTRYAKAIFMEYNSNLRSNRLEYKFKE